MTHDLARRLRVMCGGAAIAMAWAALPTSVRAEARISQTSTETENAVTMENETIRMTVNMRHGAQVTSFFHKPTSREWLASGQAMFIDHVWQQSWPGELYDVKYDYEILDRGPKQVSVKAWRVIEGKGSPGIAGLRVERVLTLKAGSPAVTADVTLINPTRDVKTAGYWSQHIFRLGGLSDDYCIRPSARGLEVGTMDYRDEGRVNTSIGADFVKDPVAGWTARVNPGTGGAAVFLMDYNDLRWLYNCMGYYTTEWYYDLLRMAPGREWKTRITLVPALGLRGVSFASPEVIADVRLIRSEDGFRPVYAVVCAGAPLKDIVLDAEWSGKWDGKKDAVRREKVTIDSVDCLPSEFVSALPVAGNAKDLLVKVALRGPGFRYEFQKPFGPFNLADKLTAGVFDTGFSMKPPEKKKVIERVATVQRAPHQGMAVLEAQGQFYPAWRVAEALAKLGPHTLTAAHFKCDVYGEQLDFFPPDLAGMMALDAVVLNNVPAEAIGPEGLALLREYVKNGGGLLVLGGWYAFGGGLYGDSPLAEILPVESGKPFDIRWYKEGVALQKNPASRLAEGVNLSEKPSVVWLQEVPRVKKDAQVVVTAGGKPFVVTGSYGKGRVACVLSAPVGMAPPGGKAFAECDRWPDTMASMLRWVKGENQ